MSYTVDTSALNKALADARAALDAVQAAVVSAPDIVGPTAFGDAIEVVAGQSVTFQPLANDQPGSSPIVGVQLVTPPSAGSVTVNADESMTYTAGPNVGSDGLSYMDIGQDGGTSMPAVVAITVKAVQPPPPSPPPPIRMNQRGIHGAHGQLASGGPLDVIGSVKRITAALQPNAPPTRIGIWPGKNASKFLKPGVGLPSDTYQKLTDMGADAVVGFPFMWFERPADVASQFPNDNSFDDVIAGRYDSLWGNHLGWMQRQGQKTPIIRIVEPNLRGSFPWGIQNAANLQQAAAAYEHFFRYCLKHYPGAYLVISHFKESHFRIRNPGGAVGPNGLTYTDVYQHPDDYCPPPDCYHGDHMDWYDGDGSPVSQKNVQAILTGTKVMKDGRFTPRGAYKWHAFATTRNHSFGFDETGLMCLVSDPKPERDNPFYLQTVENVANQLNVVHALYFNPHGGDQKIMGGTNAGTDKTTQLYTKLYNKAAA